MKFLLLSLLVAFAAGQETYEGDVVIRVIPKNRIHLHFLQVLQKDVRLDFWREATGPGNPVDIHMTATQKRQYTWRFMSMGMKIQVLIENLGPLVAAQKQSKGKAWTNWLEYETFESIEGFLADTAAAYEYVTLTDIGDSFEGRDIWLLRINKPREDGAEKTAVWLDSNIHAREWVTSAACTWIINELLTNPDNADLLDQWDFHIAPMLNPDGFAYTQESRLWRKTRSDYGEGCIGTDPNRNWDYAFGSQGASDNPCSDTYHGPSAFSESETKAASDYIFANKDSLKMYLSLHSYSQFILLPFGDSYEEPEDYDQLLDLGLIGEAAIEETGGGSWRTDTVPNLLYLASGSSHDWAKDSAGIKYSYTYELRDTGSYGFILPPEQIIPAAEETFAGVKAMLNARLTAPED